MYIYVRIAASPVCTAYLADGGGGKGGRDVCIYIIYVRIANLAVGVV